MPPVNPPILASCGKRATNDWRSSIPRLDHRRVQAGFVPYVFRAKSANAPDRPGCHEPSGSGLAGGYSGRASSGGAKCLNEANSALPKGVQGSFTKVAAPRRAAIENAVAGLGGWLEASFLAFGGVEACVIVDFPRYPDGRSASAVRFGSFFASAQSKPNRPTRCRPSTTGSARWGAAVDQHCRRACTLKHKPLGPVMAAAPPDASR